MHFQTAGKGFSDRMLEVSDDAETQREALILMEAPTRCCARGSRTNLSVCNSPRSTMTDTQHTEQPEVRV